MWRQEQLEKVKEEIQSAKVISFDVFDTLIVRLTNTPEEVFDLLEHRTGLHDFASKRQQLQMQASQKAEREEGKPHANFDEIYDYIAEHMEENVNWDEIKVAEIEVEKDVLRVNPQIREIYHYAKTLGKRIIVTSDMYFDTDQVREFVENCGYNGIDAYYVSADVNRTKYRGDIFAYISEKEKVEGPDILHIGDNAVSDVEYAKKAGWRAIQYPATEFPGSEKIENKFIFEEGVAKYLWNLQQSFWYRLGVVVGGPLYSGIIQWFQTVTEKRSFDKIFFLARDGYNLYHLYQNKGEKEISYLYTSRRALLLAGITELDEEALRILPPFTFGQTVREVLAYLGVEDVCAHYLDKAGLQSLDDVVTDLDVMDKVKRLFVLNQDGFLEKCRQERENAKKYFESIGFLNADCLVFDCGWNGSSQYLLNRFLKTIEYKGKNRFAYIGIMDTGKSRHQLKDVDYDTYLFNYDRNWDIQQSLSRGIAILELFFGAPEESLWQYGSNGLVMEQLGNDESYKVELLRGIQDYVKLSMRFVEKYHIKISAKQAIGSYLRLILAPTVEEAVTIGNVPNVDGFVVQGNEKKYIAKLDYETYKKNRKIEIYWPQGLLMRPDLDKRLRPHIESLLGVAKPRRRSLTEIIKRPFLVNWKHKGLRVAIYFHQQYKRQQGAAGPFQEWIKHTEDKLWGKGELEYQPSFSVVIPVYNVIDEQLIECIESVLHQTYKNYELILVDDCSTWDSVRKVLKKYEGKAKVKVIYREENGHISRATNTGLQAASGDFIVFSDCDDVLSEHALYEMALKLNENPELDFIYSDEDKLTEDGSLRRTPFFKPDWSPDTFMSLMYTNHLGVYRRTIVEKTGGLRSEYDGTQDYDFTLRFMEMTDNSKVGHVPKILYHWREREESIASNPEAKPYALEAVRKMKEEALSRRGIRGKVKFVPVMYQYRVVYDAPGDAMVSIVIPSKDNVDMLIRCMESIFKTQEKTVFEIIVVDNGSNDENRRKIEKYVQGKSIRYLYQPMDFNFSKMCNIGAKCAKGNYLLFLNDDIEAFEKGWLDIMTGHAAQPHVGMVGAKLLYPDSSVIQHIGITNLVIGPSHSQIGFSDNGIYYFGRNRVEYNWLAVTAACAMIKKDKFEQIGGFDEDLRVAYNDVDLCFSVYEKGYYNVVREDVVLYHYESASRGNDDMAPEKKDRLLKERKRLYEKHPELYQRDPFYNPNLTGCKVNYEIEHPMEESRLSECQITRDIYSKYQVDFLANVDEISSGDMIKIRGWYYTGAPKRDNNRSVYVILRNTKGTCYRFKAEKVMRGDVEQHLSNNTCFVGYEAYFKADVLRHEDKGYEIGIQIDGNFPRRWFVRWTGKTLQG